MAALAFWNSATQPLVSQLHRKFGTLLGMELEDFEQEAWIVASACEESGSLNPDENVLGYIKRAVLTNILSMARSELARRQRSASWIAQEYIPNEDRSYTIDQECELRELADSFSSDDWDLLAAIYEDDASEACGMLGVGRTTYYKRAAELRERINWVLVC